MFPFLDKSNRDREIPAQDLYEKMPLEEKAWHFARFSYG
jgi:hypothetical protein